jgi:hypothetical protein
METHAPGKENNARSHPSALLPRECLISTAGPMGTVLSLLFRLLSSAATLICGISVLVIDYFTRRDSATPPQLIHHRHTTGFLLYNGVCLYERIRIAPAPGGARFVDLQAQLPSLSFALLKARVLFLLLAISERY